MNNYFKISAWLVMILMLAGCRQAYNPALKDTDISLLVVEGLLNSGQGPTTIRLSRTVNLKDTATIKPELKATVTVEGDNNTSVLLTGNTRGEYSIAQLNLNSNQKYRLHIKTTNNKEYFSDYVPVQKVPLIDSISWKKTQDGMRIYANTHDPQNKTKYYRWEFDETWEFHSRYASNFMYSNNMVVPRPDPAALFYCWKSAGSGQIVVGSSAKLSADVISLAPLTFIPVGSVKISVRYSILVRQYALTQQAYEYWDIMKKNTEQVGTLFDPQPSHLLSNIHCVNNPDEDIVGYISAGSIDEKRIFITNAQAQPWIFRHDCEDELIIYPPEYKNQFGTMSLIPTSEYYSPVSGLVIGYYASIPHCVDCTTMGTNVKPTFW